MASGPHRLFLGWSIYAKEQKNLRIFAATMAAARVRKRLAKLRADRRRYHNRVLKADRPRFLRTQRARGFRILRLSAALSIKRRANARTIQRRWRGLVGRKRAWGERLVKHAFQRRLKRRYRAWRRFAIQEKRKRLAAERIQRMIRSFLSRFYCRRFLGKRKRNDERADRVFARTTRKVHKRIVRAWRVDAKATRLARVRENAKILQRWWRGLRVKWRARRLRRRRDRPKEELVESLFATAAACLDALKKNKGARRIQRCWRSKAARHLLKRTKRQRQRAKKLRRKVYRAPGKAALRVWRRVHRRNVKKARVIQNAFRTHVARTVTKRLKAARDATNGKVAHARPGGESRALPACFEEDRSSSRRTRSTRQYSSSRRTRSTLQK